SRGAALRASSPAPGAAVRAAARARGAARASPRRRGAAVRPPSASSLLTPPEDLLANPIHHRLDLGLKGAPALLRTVREFFELPWREGDLDLADAQAREAGDGGNQSSGRLGGAQAEGGLERRAVGVAEGEGGW